MSQFTVTPAHIIDSTRPMHGISTALGDVHGQIVSHSDAGAGTSGASAVEQNFSNWSSALPQFAAAADRLIGAMMASAGGYTSTDAAIAGDADTSGTPVTVTTAAVQAAGSGSIHRGPEKREKSESHELSWAPCSTAKAARCASVTRLPAVPSGSNRIEVDGGSHTLILDAREIASMCDVGRAGGKGG